MSFNLDEIINCSNKNTNPKLEVSIELLRKYKNRLNELYGYILKPFKPVWGEEPITEKEIIEDMQLILNKLKNIKRYLIEKNKCLRSCKSNLNDENHQHFIIEHFKNKLNIDEFIDLENEHFTKLQRNEDKISYLQNIIIQNMVLLHQVAQLHFI